MRRAMGAVLIVVCLMVLWAPCGDGGFRVGEKGAVVWMAGGGGWEMYSEFKAWRLVRLADVLSKIPAGVEAAKMYGVMVAEPGVWLGFSIKFGAVEKVVFTKSTRIVLIDKGGKRYESEACLFTPDLMQTEVYDARKKPVVVTRKSVWSKEDAGRPCGVVKFAEGSFRMEDIVEFEVVGAIEDTTYRETR
ncbi:MAG: hypothetical protein NTX17_01265 [Candidatus Eisenbacteria bacterium]|nr:hypothetical protein [Candidatus Eisenbacteria bacterium]